MSTKLCPEAVRLRELVRELYVDAHTCDDSTDFILGIRDQFEKEIKDWGEDPEKLFLDEDGEENSLQGFDQLNQNPQSAVEIEDEQK